MVLTHNGKHPVIAENVFVAPSAVIIGDVVIQEGASIWFNAVVRGDLAPITIGANTNIQDNCTLHIDANIPLIIGSNVTIGHNAVVHGCTIEDHVLIGMNAVILNRAVIGKGSVVAAGAMVKEGQHIGPFQMAAGMPARVKKDLEENVLSLIDSGAEHYKVLARSYMKHA